MFSFLFAAIGTHPEFDSNFPLKTMSQTCCGALFEPPQELHPQVCGLKLRLLRAAPPGPSGERCGGATRLFADAQRPAESASTTYTRRSIRRARTAWTRIDLP